MIHEIKNNSNNYNPIYACYLIGMDEYGDKIIENFIKEDSEYFFRPYSDTLIKNYKSNENIIIDELDYQITSCIFLIGEKYNDKFTYLQDKYELNVIKILKDKTKADGDRVFYSNDYNQIKSFLRLFILPVGDTYGLINEFLTSSPTIEDVKIINVKEYGLVSRRWKEHTDEEWNSVFNYIISRIEEKETKCMLRFIMPNSKQFMGFLAMSNLSEEIIKKVGYDMNWAYSCWDKDYYEVILVYEK